MNAERLLANFERISEAPDAIARLRRFILDLAVRGKLVEQDTNDVKPQGFMKQDQTRTPFDLPSNWIWVQIGDQLNLINGMAFKSTDWMGTGLRIVRIQNLNNPNAPFNYCDPGIARERSLIDNGSFLISWSGTPGTSFGAFIWERGPAVLNQHIFRCDFKTQSFNSIFLRLGINGRLDEMISKAHGGVGLQHITKGKLEALPIPLPPLAEQHRIVAKVDELMALCDQLEAARNQREQGRERLMAATLQRLNQPSEDPASFRQDAFFALQVLPSLTTTPALIKQLRQTILNLAVRGKLVEQDPEDEPAEELLASFAVAKVELRKSTGDARIKIEDAPSPEALPWSLPVGWMCQSFQNLFLFIDYRGNTPPKTNDGVPLITAKNVRMGRLEREPQEFLSQTTFEKWMTRGFPRVGDLFFTTEAPLGNVCLNDINEPFALAQRVICLQPYADINTKFIMFALMSDLMQFMIGEHATGLTAKGIKAAKLKPLPIPLPPLAEQHRIVAKVDTLLALCDQLEQQLSQTDQQRRRLLEAVLAEALGGRLPTAQEESHAVIA